MTRHAILILGLLVLPLLLTACKGSPQYPAEVQLKVDGKSLHYTTAAAEFDDHGGPLSVYLLPDDFKDGGSAYACLRYYSGNPAGHFWVRYSPDGSLEGNSRPRYECFVPGTLDDGTKTLTWGKVKGDDEEKLAELRQTHDGLPAIQPMGARWDAALVLLDDVREFVADHTRHRTETGERDCHVSLTREGDDLVLEFDVQATLEKRGKGGHGGGGGDHGAELPAEVHAIGRGVMSFPAGVLADDAAVPEAWWGEAGLTDAARAQLVADLEAPDEAPVVHEEPAADDDDSAKDDDDSAKDDDDSAPAPAPPAE